MAIDQEAIKEHIRGILIALGDDPDREDCGRHRTGWRECMQKCLKG